MIISIQKIFGKSLAKSAFLRSVFADSIKNSSESFIVPRNIIYEKTIQEITEIDITCSRKKFVFRETRKIEIFYQGGIEWKKYAGKWFADGEFFGEYKCIYDIFKFSSVIVASRKIIHMFDRYGSIDVEIFWQDESFIADKIVYGFDKSGFSF